MINPLLDVFDRHGFVRVTLTTREEFYGYLTAAPSVAWLFLTEELESGEKQYHAFPLINILSIDWQEEI